MSELTSENIDNSDVSTTVATSSQEDLTALSNSGTAFENPAAEVQLSAGDYRNEDSQIEKTESASESTTRDEHVNALPRYRGDTQVQPKFVLNGDTDRNAEKDIIVNAFNQGSFVGIRSLPNAFRPDFRQKLYELVLENKHSQGSLSKNTINNKHLDNINDAFNKRLSYSTEILPGMRYQIPFSGAPRAFSSFTYMSSEYDRPSELSISQSKVERSRWVSDMDFKVTALPQVPRSAGSFNEFHYAIDPYEYGEVSASAERNDMLTKRLFGPLRAAGRAAANEQKKILRRECLNRLRILLRRDWPGVFVSAEEDNIGCIMLTFDACVDKSSNGPEKSNSAASMGQGNSPELLSPFNSDARLGLLRNRDKMVANYVSNFCQRDAISDEFQLRRDTTRWAMRIGKHKKEKPNQAVGSAEVIVDGNNEVLESNTDVQTDGSNDYKREDELLVFHLIPPWVHYNAVPISREQSMVSLSNTSDHVTNNTPLLSSRVPFGPQTNSGNLILAHTRTLNRSFKFV